jgi:hypothetical protein
MSKKKFTARQTEVLKNYSLESKAKKTKVTKAARRRRQVDIVRSELALKNELKEVWE